MRLLPSNGNTRIVLNDLRPDSIDEKVRTAIEKDIAFLGENLSLFESRFCPACQSQDFEFFCEKEIFVFLRCVACLSILMNPAPNSDLLARLYGQSENYKVWGSFVYPLTSKSRWGTLHKRRSEKITQAVDEFISGADGQAKNKLRYLELGAGSGDTVQRFRSDSADRNLEVLAVEINPTMLDILRQKSIPTCSFDEVMPGSQDVIAAFEVLEHLLDPLEILRIAIDKLVPGGLFVFSTPNALSLEVQMLGDRSTTLDHEHISVLSLVGLGMAAKTAGFIVRRLEAAGSLDAELIAKANGESPGHSVFSEKYGWGSQEDISQANLSSSSFGVFQKPFSSVC